MMAGAMQLAASHGCHSSIIDQEAMDKCAWRLLDRAITPWGMCPEQRVHETFVCCERRLCTLCVSSNHCLSPLTFPHGTGDNCHRYEKPQLSDNIGLASRTCLDRYVVVNTSRHGVGDAHTSTMVGAITFKQEGKNIRHLGNKVPRRGFKSVWCHILRHSPHSPSSQGTDVLGDGI